MRLIRADNQIFCMAAPLKKWDPEEQLPGFESHKKAQKRRDNFISILQTGDADAVALAGILRDCRNGRRCHSGACPVCVRMVRRRWTGQVAKLISQHPAEWNSVTLVSESDAKPLGSLHKFDPRKSKDRLRKQLDRYLHQPLLIVGGIDFAVESFRRSLPTWVPHFYLLYPGSQDLIYSALCGYFKPSFEIPRPIVTHRIKKMKEDIFEVSSYSYKHEFDERTPGYDANGNDKPRGTEITDDHWIELAPRLHDWGFTARLVQRLIRS